MPEGGDDIFKIKEEWKRFKNLGLLQKVVIILPYAIVISLCIRVCELFRLCDGNIFTSISHIDYIWSPYIHLKIRDIIIGSTLGYGLVWFIKWDRKRHIKKTRTGIEHGAARWGTAEDVAPFIDPDPFGINST